MARVVYDLHYDEDKIKNHPIKVRKKHLHTIKKLLIAIENDETTEEALLSLLAELELSVDDFQITKRQPAKAVRKVVEKVPDFLRDPPLRSGLLYDDSPEPLLLGRYIYLQKGDQEILDRFCQSWLDTYERDKNFFLTIDLETKGLNPVLPNNHILLHGISWDGQSAIVFEHQKFDLTLYKQVLNTVPLNNHNIKFDLKWLRHHLGVDPILMWDTMVCAQLGWAGIFPTIAGKTYTLDNVVQQLLRPYRISKGVRQEFYTKLPGTGFSRAQVEYGVRDALLTHRLVEPQYIRLRNHGLLDLWQELEQPLLSYFTEWELKGIPVNYQTAFTLYKEKEAELAERREALNQAIRELPADIRPKPGPGGDYNPISYKQLPLILASIGIRVVDTKAETLEMVRADHPHPILIQIIEYRTLHTQISKLLKKLCEEFIDPNTNCIYPVNNTCGAITGRLSVQEPPLHQVQEHTRPVIEAPEGWSLIGRDYSQFEFRACAAETEEERLLTLFKERARVLPLVRDLVHGLGWDDPDDFCKKLFSDKEKDKEKMKEPRSKLSQEQLELLKEFSRLDIHRANASGVFQLPTDKIGPDQRQICKTLGYAILYGSSISTVRAQLASDGYIYSEAECRGFYDAFFESLPKVKRFIEKVHKGLKNGSFVSTLSGRKRFFELPPKYMTFKYNEKKAANEREAVNYFFQAANADATKRSMVMLEELWRSKWPNTDHRPRIIINVHDELVALCPDEYVKEADADMEQIMIECGEIAVGGKCPVEVSGMIMKRWVK